MISLLIIGLQRKSQVGVCGDSVVHGKMVLRRRRLYYVIVCICMLDLTSSQTHTTNPNVGAGRPLSAGHAARWQLTSQQRASPLIETLQALKTTSPQNATSLCRQHSVQSSCLTSTDPGINFFLSAVNFSRLKQRPADKQGASKSYKRTSHVGLEQPSFHLHGTKTNPVRPCL